jgi:hypothetical protein
MSIFSNYQKWLLAAIILTVLLFCGIAHAEPFFASSVSSQPRPAGTKFYATTAMLQPVSPKTAFPEGNEEDQSVETPAPSRVESSASRPTVPGSRAIVRRGIAYAPANAPENIKRAIWATNQLRNKPYRWGGGHASFYDRGYDCSGTVSYFLHHAGVLRSPMPSRGFLSYGKPGKGRWVSVYSRRGHTYAVVAGLRLDTTGFADREGPRWRSEPRNPRGFKVRHPVGL